MTARTSRTSRTPLLLGLGALVLVSGGLVTYTLLDDDARTGGSGSGSDDLSLACGIAQVRPTIPEDPVGDDDGDMTGEGFHEVALELALLQSAALADDTMVEQAGPLQDLYQQLLQRLEFEGAEADLTAFEEELCRGGDSLPEEYSDRLEVYTEHACGLLPAVAEAPWVEEKKDDEPAVALAWANLTTIGQVGMMTDAAGVEEEFTEAARRLQAGAQNFDEDGYAREVAAFEEVCADL